jgi:chorismate dehydratase
MPFRLAAVSFLETVPLIDWLQSRPAPECRLTLDLPSRLAEHLHADTADAALLPVVELFRHDGARLVPGGGIATRGAVGSVKLFTSEPLATLARVLVDRGSRTSVALLRILLAELFGVRPDFHAVEPRPQDPLAAGEAVLVIGDRCFARERSLREAGRAGVRAYDLGELWVRLTGLPFVFAAWALGRGFAQRATPAAQAELKRLLRRSREHGLARLPELAAREAAAGRLGPGGRATPEALQYYFRECLQYTLGPREMAGLQRFHELCLLHAVCPPGQPLRLDAAGDED